MTSDHETAKVTDKLDNSFEVPLPPAEAWPILMDIGRIAPFIPGVELTDVVDEKTIAVAFQSGSVRPRSSFQVWLR
jgi:carbon monoxide dehydrogenase subunit G